MSDADRSQLVDLDLSRPVWDRVFLVAPLVVVGTREELDSNRVTVSELNWLSEAPSPGSTVRTQLRYRAPAVEAEVESVSEGTLTMRLKEAHAAVTPGQSAVVFDGEVVLGGGRIAKAGRSEPVSA